MKKLVEKVNNLSKLIDKSNLQGVNSSAQDFANNDDISTQTIEPDKPSIIPIMIESRKAVVDKYITVFLKKHKV